MNHSFAVTNPGSVREGNPYVPVKMTRLLWFRRWAFVLLRTDGERSFVLAGKDWADTETFLGGKE